MKEQFFILEFDNVEGFRGVDVHGPFPSESACYKFVREGAMRVYEQNDRAALQGTGSGNKVRDETWGSNHVIVKQIVTIKPVPCVETRVSIDLVESEQKGKPTYVE